MRNGAGRLDLREPTGSIAVSAGNFFRSRRANMIVGRLTGALQYTSYSAWNKSHNIQHHINHGKDVRTSAPATFYCSEPNVQRIFTVVVSQFAF